jgi:hypothetical protein
MVLAIPAGLGTLVAENRGPVVEFHGLGQAAHTVLQIGSADGGRALRPERQQVPAAVSERIHLLLYDVGAFANTTYEQAAVLEDWCVNAMVAV